MKRWIMLCLGLATVGLAVFALSSRRSSEAQRAARDTSQEVSALREELAEVKRKAESPRVYYAGSQPEPDARPASLAPSAQPPGAQPVAEAERAQDPVELARERQLQAVTELEARLASEHVDGEWSVQAARQIRDVFGASTPGTALVEAECASSLCRVVVSHESPDAQRALGPTVSAAEPFMAGVLYDYDQKSNPPTTTMFVLRQGRSFREDSESL
jgi:hypothetical protein